jgi:hypothetical protein
MGLFDTAQGALGPLNSQQGTPDYTGVQYHTSAQAIPIAIMWGTRRISPQIIWQSNLTESDKITGNPIFFANPAATETSPYVEDQNGLTGRWQGEVIIQAPPGEWGNTDPNASNSKWWIPMILALCEGPINSINRVWNGGGATAVLWTNRYSLVTTAAIGYSVFLGTTGQTAWNFFAFADSRPGGPYYPGQDLSYRLTAYLASGLVDGGKSNSPPQQSFEVIRTPITGDAVTDSYNIAKDYPTSDIVSDFLANPIYGMGFTSGDIDSASLLLFFQYCMAQGMLLSPLLTSQTSGVDIIDRWAIVSNTWIFYDGLLFRFVPLGDESVTANGQTYTPDLAPAYNLTYDDFLSLPTVDRADPIDCYNRVRIEFCDRANDYSKNPVEWKDTTLINQFGISDASNIDGQDICDIVVAARVVELFGKRMAYLRNTYTFTTSYKFILMIPGTVCTLTDSALGITNQLVRIRTVEEADDGKLQFVAEELPGTLGLSRPMPAPVWNPTGGASGSTGGSTTPGLGSATPTSGGVLVMTASMNLVLFVAGDVVTLPPLMTPGVPYVFIHDQQRSPQPTPAMLEENPATFKRPATGATYNILDLYDRTATPATSITVDRRSGLTFTLVYTGDNLVRPVD